MNPSRLRRDRERQAWSRAVSCETAIGSVVASLIHDSSEREDLALQALIRLAEHLRGHGPEVEAKTWACRIARDVCYRHLRRAGHEPETVPLSEIDGAAGSPGALRAWEDILRGERVRAALASLPAHIRTAFQLHWGEGLTVKETAAALRMKPQTLRISLERHMKALREKLGEDMG